MRVLILTSSLTGSASCYLPHLAGVDSFKIVGVVRTRAISARRSRRRWRKIQKTARIGVLGALNGVRIRKWFRPKGASNLQDLCSRLAIPFFEEAYTASDETRSLFRSLNADLGLSLGNGYIPPSLYNIPRLGMVNVHTEVLPKYRGAQSVIWPIYEQDYHTGFTIHQINKKIDGGRILFVESRPIQFHPTLKETVEQNLHETRHRVPMALSDVVMSYESLVARMPPQPAGPGFTTPTFLQFSKMVRNNREMYKAASRGIHYGESKQ